MLANGGVSSEDGNVRRGMKLFDGAYPSDDRPGRFAIRADDEGRDALSDLRFGQRIGEDAFGGMIVNIDEARGEDEAFGVDDGFTLFRGEVADFFNVIEVDADISLAQGRAGAVGELGVDDKEGRRLLLGMNREKKTKREAEYAE